MDDNNAYEQAYKNGKERMRQAILEKLKTARGFNIGLRRWVISDIIELVEKLEVRP